MITRLRRWFTDATRPGVPMLDDRGREFYLAPRVTDLHELPRESQTTTGSADADRAGAPEQPQRRTTLRSGLIAIAALVFSLSLLAAALAMFGLGVLAIARRVARLLHTSMLVAVPITIGGGTLALLVLGSISRPAHKKRLGLSTVIEFLRLGFCPSCGYSLHNVPADADGCTPCPECGAAWNSAKWAFEYPPLTPPADSPIRPFTRRFNVVDARFRTVQLLSNRRENRAALFRSRTRSTPREIRVGDLVRILLVFLPVAVFLLAFGAAPKLPVMLALLSVESLVIPAVLATAISARREAARRAFMKQSLTARRCPCCEGPLRDAPSCIDGALVCPGCGSAWKAG